MRAIAHLSTRFPSNRTLPCPLLDDQELSPSLDNSLLAFQRVNLSVNPDVRVVLEEFQVPVGEIWVRACFKS